MAIKDIQNEIDFYKQKHMEAVQKKVNLRKSKRTKKQKVFDQKIHDRYSIYNGDSVEVIKNIPDNSVHYSLFSPPFSSLFVYSDSERDMGNCKNDSEFYDHFEYLVSELYRVIMEGRLVSFHCMNLPLTIQHDGVLGIKDFRGDLIRLFQAQGFIFHSEVVIWKDPLIQAVRTKNLGLAHKQIVKDSTRCTMGYPDYIITMRKPGVNTEPVSRKRGFEQYIGEKQEPKNKKNDNHSINKYSHFVWQRYASPVWMDIRQTNTLNYQQAKDEKDEKHICPLQIDVIGRCLDLWTNENDIVLSPFAGIGSEGYVSLNMKRRFIGMELKPSYYKTMAKYLRKASKKRNNQISLFD